MRWHSWAHTRWLLGGGSEKSAVSLVKAGRTRQADTCGGYVCEWHGLIGLIGSAICIVRSTAGGEVSNPIGRSAKGKKSLVHSKKIILEPNRLTLTFLLILTYNNGAIVSLHVT
jgi:hypothetical protein